MPEKVFIHESMTGLHIRPLSREELVKYIEIGRSFFPDADWPGAPTRLGSMMERWSDGILAVLDDREEILGYYTFWPITSEAFEGFESGIFKDEDMCVLRMPDHPRLPQHHWILTAIAVKPTEHDVRKEIITMIVSDLNVRTYGNVPCKVLAHAATQDGHRFLKRTGFEVSNPLEPTVYTLRVESKS